MYNLPTLSIGIAAYNAQANIQNLLSSLLAQKQQKFVLEKIIVYSDKSSDATSAKAQEVIDSRIVIVEGQERVGFAGAVKFLLAASASELTMLLNDDIQVTDPHFVDKAIEPFFQDENVGLVSANPQPLKATNFYERATVSAFRVYERMRYSFRKGNNLHTCDGKVLTFSKTFKQSIEFPTNYADMGNVDCYLYLECIQRGFLYRHARNAVVWFKCPSVRKDYFSWTLRNTSDYEIMKKKFGKIAEQEFYLPPLAFVSSFIKEFFSNPLGCLFLVYAHYYIAAKLFLGSKGSGHLWQIVESTKTFSK